MVVFLGLYNVRKKLPFLPLGNSRSWLDFHVFIGWLTVLVFILHIGLGLPQGAFEGVLASLYVGVTVSGALGLFMSRAFARRLTTRGGEVIFETISTIRRNVQEEVERLALSSIPETDSTIIADFYTRRLKHFFDGARNFWLHLFESRRPLKLLLEETARLDRYFTQDERSRMREITDLIRFKDGLDYHHSLQAALKRWLFVHIPLTYSLLIFAFAHLALVQAFSGGVR